jgi:hypothetical protein
VSPHFPSSAFTSPDLTPEQKIELFADAVRGWQLDVAERLIAVGSALRPGGNQYIAHNFEMMGKYQDGFTGKGKSKHYFIEGFRWFTRSTLGGELRQLEKRLAMIYDQLRNAMYHDGTIGSGVVVSGEIESSVFQLQGDELHLNPKQLVRALQIHCSCYIAELLGDRSSQLRINFLRRYDWRQEAGQGISAGNQQAPQAPSP